MPIAINAVPDAEFQTWVKDAKTKFAAGEPVPPSPAQAAAAAAAPTTLAAAQIQR